MKTLVIGSGGREHALAWALSQNPKREAVFVSPGNGGTESEFRNVPLDLSPPYKSLVSFVRKEGIGLVVVGPEIYLVEGMVDVLEKEGITVFGPRQAAARIEGSKSFAKEIMEENNVPTAGYRIFTELESACEYLDQISPPYVLKADGLAAGKGVAICETREEALKTLEAYLVKRRFGEAGGTLLIESFLSGWETSILAFTDGTSVRLLPAAQDHKRALDGDRGPNTGGMGAYASVRSLESTHLETIERDILLPTLRGMKRKGMVYRGVLYAGLMIDGEDIRVVEFNCRLGDPEAQCVLPLLRSDLGEILLACAHGKLDRVPFEISNRAACTVVLASGGYPGSYSTGLEISGLDQVEDVLVFHAGTRRHEGKFHTSGGRVLAITAIRDSLDKAVEHAYSEADKIHYKKRYYRKDIGRRGSVFGEIKYGG